MSANPTTILVVDDHEIVREGVRSLLAASRPDWNILEAGGGAQAVQTIQGNPPDLVVMDITMPDASGLQVTSRLRKTGFARPVLIFTMHESAALTGETKNAGAQGYVLKSQATEDLVRAIDILLAGGTFFGAPPDPTPSPREPHPGLIFFRGFAPSFA